LGIESIIHIINQLGLGKILIFSILILNGGDWKGKIDLPRQDQTWLNQNR